MKFLLTSRCHLFLMAYLLIAIKPPKSLYAWPHDASASGNSNHQLHHGHHSGVHSVRNHSSTDTTSSSASDSGVVNSASRTTGVRHSDWRRMEMMDANGLYMLEWWTKAKDIYFRVTVNTQGFIGLGFSRKTGRMAGADMVLLWVDDRTGKPNALVS